MGNSSQSDLTVWRMFGANKVSIGEHMEAGTAHKKSAFSMSFSSKKRKRSMKNGGSFGFLCLIKSRIFPRSAQKCVNVTSLIKTGSIPTDASVCNHGNGCCVGFSPSFPPNACAFGRHPFCPYSVVFSITQTALLCQDGRSCSFLYFCILERGLGFACGILRIS